MGEDERQGQRAEGGIVEESPPWKMGEDEIASLLGVRPLRDPGYDEAMHAEIERHRGTAATVELPASRAFQVVSLLRLSQRSSVYQEGEDGEIRRLYRDLGTATIERMAEEIAAQLERLGAGAAAWAARQAGPEDQRDAYGARWGDVAQSLMMLIAVGDPPVTIHLGCWQSLHVGGMAILPLIHFDHEELGDGFVSAALLFRHRLVEAMRALGAPHVAGCLLASETLTYDKDGQRNPAPAT